MENKSQGERRGDLPSCATEFIRQVMREMGCRRKTRQEVEAELRAHFEDELKDCTETPEREQKAQRLTEEFGDAKLLAVLCRRGKKRCRPLWAKAMVRSLQAVGVLVVVLSLYTLWFVNGKPSVTVDYLALLNQMSRPDVADQDNAWPHYRWALSLTIPDYDLKQIPACQHPDYPEHWDLARLTGDAQRAIVKWIEANRQPWDQFVLAGSKPYLAKSYECWSANKDATLMSIQLPELWALSNLARLGIWSARLHVQQGRTAQALADCLALARAGRQWQHSATFIEQLIGLSLSRHAHEEILRMVARRELAASELSDWQRKLAAAYPQGYPLADVRGEHLILLDVVQHLFTDRGLGGGHLVPSAAATLLEEEMGQREKSERPIVRVTRSMLHVGREETVATVSRIFDPQQSLLSPYERRARQVPTVKEILESLSPHRYALVRVLVGDVDRVTERGFRGKALHEATLTILALQRYRREKGAYPATLDDLKQAGYLAVLPADPYSDKPLSYKVTGASFVLYSLGPDFHDDDGESGRGQDGRPKAWADKGDTVFWPVNP
ncbi:MAG: hypothetical protein M1376_16475 [Planctomycetes bacterium]|nr:hypothetical protein [Planctomycetota bacterium]